METEVEQLLSILKGNLASQRAATECSFRLEPHVKGTLFSLINFWNFVDLSFLFLFQPLEGPGKLSLTLSTKIAVFSFKSALVFFFLSFFWTLST